MTPRLQADLDYWLPRWWRWREPVGVSEGHPSVCAGLEQYRSSRQYDDQNGALDHDVDAMILEQLDHEIHALAQLESIAIQYEARRLCIGVAVFRARILPVDSDELAALVLRARDKLIEKLVACGVLSVYS